MYEKVKIGQTTCKNLKELIPPLRPLTLRDLTNASPCAKLIVDYQLAICQLANDDLIYSTCLDDSLSSSTNSIQ